MSYLHQEKSSVCCTELNRQIAKLRSSGNSDFSSSNSCIRIAGDQLTDIHGILFQKHSNPLHPAGLLPLYGVASIPEVTGQLCEEFWT